MSISLYGLFLLFYVIYIIAKHKRLNIIFDKLFFITLVTTFYIRMGFFVRIGNNMMTYSSFLIYITGVFSLIIVIKKRVLFNIKAIYMLLFLSCNFFIARFAPYGKEVIVNFDHYLATLTNYIQYNDYYGKIIGVQLGYYFTAVFLIIILQCANFFFSKETWKKLFYKNLEVSKIFIAIGFLDCFFVNVLKSNFITDFTILLFGSYGAQHNGIYTRGKLAVFQGATQEASMLNFVLFYSLICWLIAYVKNRNKHCILWIILINILLLLNPSLSAIVYLIIEFLILLLGILSKKNNIVQQIKLGFITLLMIGTGMPLYSYLI